MTEIGVSGNRFPKPGQTPKKRVARYGPILLSIILVSVLLGCVLMPRQTTTPPVAEETQTEPLGYSRWTNGTSTVWRFEDYQALYDVEYPLYFVFAVHDCRGENGTVSAWEYQGNYLDDFPYQGQRNVSFSYLHSTSYYPNGTIKDDHWHWFGNVTRDWRAGNWTPDEGIEFRHSINQTFMNATLLAVWFVPIPEFSELAIVIVGMIAVMLVIRRARGRR